MQMKTFVKVWLLRHMSGRGAVSRLVGGEWSSETWSLFGCWDGLRAKGRTLQDFRGKTVKMPVQVCQ